jgi:hypothetical protein
VSLVELINLIHSLKNNKSSSVDCLNPRLLKENAYLLSVPLQYLFNLSLTKGVVPKKFKIAKVIPIFKQGRADQPSNYRPISILSVFNKLLEKIVHKRLYNFLVKHSILYQNQFGFRKNFSTSLALLQAVDSCYENLDLKNNVIGIFFDLQKAFDTVDHSILQSKLYYYGIRGLLFNWLKNYLSDRQQYTVVNNVSSNMGEIKCGVPQGSVLGPLLFLIYINDINKAVPKNELNIFADDTNLFISGPTISLVEKTANDCLKCLDYWFCANKLSLNTDKTFYMLFGHSNKSQPNLTIKLTIDGVLLNKVPHCKYLGVILDDELKWDKHVDFIYNKLTKFTSIFYKLRFTVPIKILYKLYYAFVYPLISYGIEIYANASNASLDKLIKMNNKILRIILNKNFETPNLELYRIVNVLPINLLHEFKLLELIFKFQYSNHLLPEVFQTYFCINSYIHNHSTRSQNNIHLPSVNSNFGKRRSVFRAGLAWNNLPNNLKLLSSNFVFRKSVKQYLLFRDNS